MPTRIRPRPKPQPEPPPPPPIPVKPPKKRKPPPVTPVQVITKDTPFREVGAVSAARVCEILKGYPMASECQSIATVAGNALALAQSYKESQYGKTAGRTNTGLPSNNPLGLMVPGSNPSQLMAFRSWADAFREWQRRMDDPTYSGGVYMPLDMSLEQFISTYVGGPGCWSSKGARCANGETKQSVELYLQQTIDRLNRYFGHTASTPVPDTPSGAFRDVTVAGSSKPLRLPVGLAFEQSLTPVGPNRSGRPLNWTGCTQHTTNNTSRGADARMHARWQNSGTPGHPDGRIGVHWYVDDQRVVQMIPVDEQGVHSGDWRNQQHVAVELCVNSDRNAPKAEANAVALQAGLLHILGTTGTRSMYPHTKGALGHCPRLSVPWARWEELVDRQIQAIEGD